MAHVVHCLPHSGRSPHGERGLKSYGEPEAYEGAYVALLTESVD